MLYIVGIGPGNREGMTIDAENVLKSSDVIIGYKKYVELISDYFPNKKYISNGMKQEKERVLTALEEAESKTVSLICSGDPELYGMAGLAYELNEKYPETEIKVIAGVTAALSGGALLGSPLTHDFAVISLSDLLTPAEKIITRLELASQADLVMVLYNPSSKNRPDHLKKACEIIMKYKSEKTVCGIVKNIGRQGEEYKIMTLSELKNTQVDMFTTVYVGSRETKIINNKMVTPRGYKDV